MANTSMEVSAISMGTWAMGGDKFWGSQHDDQRYIDTIVCAIDHGINMIDTAVVYGEGHSEEIVGKAIKGKKDKLFISTKALSGMLTPDVAQKTIEGSLKRLGVDYIDIYYIHWPNPDISVAFNMESLEKLREKGLIRYIGVSNFTMRHLDIARTAGTIDVIQSPYSLFWRNIESGILPYCIKNNIGMMTYSSIAMGLLSGKYTRDASFEEGDIRGEQVPLFKNETFEKALDAVEKFKEIADRYGSSIAQAAINWVISQKGVSTAIVGARNPAQLEENIKALDFKISVSDLKKMGDICKPVSDRVADWDTMYEKDSGALKIKE